VPTGFPTSVPVIPTSVPDRRLTDATRITDMVICRKVVFCKSPKPPVVMLNLFQHNEQTPPVILKPPLVILNLFQDNEKPSPVILKQVQDDEGCGR
jgi:hypothetical protein